MILGESMLFGIESNGGFFTALASIVMIDIMLAGDNAVVIAMAVRSLPPRAKTTGIILGVAGAIMVRVICTFLMAKLLSVEFLKMIGGVLILYIAVKLLTEDYSEDSSHRASNLWKALWLIIVADISMGTDNMLAVAAASYGNIYLIGFGLLLSIPFVVFTSSLLAKLMDRYPIILYIGAAILGKIGGELIITDPAVQALLSPSKFTTIAFILFSALSVVAAGRLLQLTKPDVSSISDHLQP
jgi:YjbE family integral membrane protein